MILITLIKTNMKSLFQPKVPTKYWKTFANFWFMSIEHYQIPIRTQMIDFSIDIYNILVWWPTSYNERIIYPSIFDCNLTSLCQDTEINTQVQNFNDVKKVWNMGPLESGPRSDIFQASNLKYLDWLLVFKISKALGRVSWK